MRFVLIDETVVSHGFWVKLSGLDITQFERNPIMLWMHQRPSSFDGKNQILPIGRWEELRFETVNGINALTAKPIFDEKDEFARQIKSKVEGGFIKMASVGIKSIELSESPEYIKQGQTRSTITKSELLEVSIVDIGANKNAVKLYDDKGEVNLSELSENYIPKLNFKYEYNMKAIALKLGLGENATENEILSAITKLQQKEAEAETMKKERVEKLMQHESITPENKDTFRKLAETNYELAEHTLNLLSTKEKKEQPKGERVSEYLAKAQPGAAKDKKWNDYTEKELSEMRDKQRDVYLELYEEEFGFYPKMD